MIVVADTTPLQYLILIQCEHILPALYGRVVVPPAVIAELSRDETPQPVRDWLKSAPAWLEIRGPREVGRSSVPLGAGELEAIALAEELRADARLINAQRAAQAVAGSFTSSTTFADCASSTNNSMASRIRRRASSTVRPCVWHPRTSRTEATHQPDSSR